MSVTLAANLNFFSKVFFPREAAAEVASPQRTTALEERRFFGERTDKARATFPAQPKASTSPHRHFPKLAPPSTGLSLPILSHRRRCPHRAPPLSPVCVTATAASTPGRHPTPIRCLHRCYSRPTTAHPPLRPPHFCDHRNTSTILVPLPLPLPLPLPSFEKPPTSCPHLINKF